MRGIGIQKSNDTSVSIILYQIILYTAMMSGYKGIAYYISIFAAALFVGRIVIKNGANIPVNKAWKCFMLFLAFYTITSRFNFISDSFYTYFAYYTLCFFPILISEYLIKKSTTEMIIKSLKCFMFIFVIFCLISIGYYLSHPRLARQMAAHMVEDKLAIGGGYSLAYAAATLCVYFFSKMFNGRIETKMSYLFICAIFMYVVYLTESSITTLAMVVGIVISLITRENEVSRNKANELLRVFIIGFIGLAITMVVVYNKYTIAEWVLDFTDGKDENLLYSRIAKIVNKFVYGKTDRHVDERSATLTNSIEIFKHYPLFGMGYKYGNVFAWGKYLGMGNHSEILDAFARHGLVGGCLWLTPYFRTIKMILKKNLGCVVTILIMMYFNPFLSFHSNAVMFMVIPLVEEILSRKDQSAIEVIESEVK